MKRNLFLLVALLFVTFHSFGQVSGSSFEMYVMNYRFGPKALNYFDSKNIVVTNYMAHNAIEQDGNRNKVDPAKVRETLEKLFRSSRSGGRLVLNWERQGVFKALRDYPSTDSRYKYAEAEWRKLIKIVRDTRPNVEIGIYGIPFKAWTKRGVAYYNPDKKYDNLLSLVDFLAPSVYIQFADEEVGHARNLKYMQDIMDVALDYGKRLRKPVYPFLWQRVHNTNPVYGSELIQTDVFAKYVKFLSTYSYNGYKAKGFYWWEALSKSDNLRYVKGMSNWAKGLITNYDSYDAMMVKYAQAVVKTLSGVSAEQSAGVTSKPSSNQADSSDDKAPSSSNQKVVSYVLFDSRTGKDIQTITNGSVLNVDKLPTTNLNIRAITNSKVGSVKFYLGGEQTKTRIENSAPYDLMGDNGRLSPATGEYVLKAVPYSGNKATGAAGTSLTINFKIINSSSNSFDKGGTFTLVNADNNKDIQELKSGATLNLAALPTKNLNIRFNPKGQVGSVVFELSGTKSAKKTESGAPYALFGDNKANYFSWTPALGSYTVEATPYSESSGRGKSGDTESIDFTVINNKNSDIAVSSLASKAMASTNSAMMGSSTDDVETLKVYPVPATTVLYVEVNEEAGEGAATIELQDMNGKAVLSKKVNSTTHGYKIELDVTNVKEGLYVLAVSSSQGRITKRVVIN